jgi:HTH-type transcriptional regulator/antitoxin HigA
MEIKPIHTKKDYELALARVDALMDAALDTEEGDELDILTTLISVYEEKNFPISTPDPIEAIKFRLEQLGLDKSHLQNVIRSRRGRVSEVLNKRRPLSLTMIRHLSLELKIQPEVLIKEYPLKQKTHKNKGHA